MDLQSVSCSINKISSTGISLQNNRSHYQCPITNVFLANGKVAKLSDIRIGAQAELYHTKQRVHKVVIKPTPLSESVPMTGEISMGFEAQKIITSPNERKPGANVPQEGLPVRAMRPKKKEQAAVQKEIEDTYSQGVLHYSQMVFPISLLKQEYKFSQEATLAFELIETKCVGIRRCNAGGSSGMYTALAFSFVEHLARKTTPASELAHVISRIKNSYPIVSRVLGELQVAKAEDHGGMQWLNSHNRSDEFWSQMTKFLADYTLVFMKEYGPVLDFLGGLTPETTQLFILDGDSNIPIKVLAKAFDLKIVIYSPDILAVKSIYSTEEENRRLSYLYLFRDGNMFHLLYSQAQLSVEGYNLSTCHFDHQPALTPDSSRLYFTTRKRDQIPSHLVNHIEVLRASIKRDTQFSTMAQGFIASIMDVIDNRAMVSMNEQETVSSFFDEELVSGTLLLMFEYSKSLEEFHKFPGRTVDGFVDEILEEVKEAPLHPILNRQERFEHMNVCCFCHSNKGQVILDCRHSFCWGCIQDYIAKRIKESPLLLKPNGETTEDFVCPKMTCFIRISGAKFEEVVGHDYFADYLASTERLLGKVHCKHCGKIRTLDKFSTLCPCNSTICLLCYCESVRKDEAVCVCGQLLSQEALKVLEQLTTRCSVCLNVKSTLKDFTAVECEDHVLCEECLGNASRQEGRCPTCYRVFSHKECSDLQYLRLYKFCMSCGQECRKSRLNTSCGCIFCQSCATRLANETQKFLECFNCRVMLPEYGTNQLRLWVTPSSVQEPKDCPICYYPISAGTEQILSCGDFFHFVCLSNFYISLLEGGHSDDTASCPNGICKNKTPGNELQAYVPPELFKIYYENFMKEHSTPCPRCHSQILDQDENGGKKNALICHNDVCRFHFCVACKGEYKLDHDEKRCKFNKIQSIVKDTELEAKIVGGAVGQCPICKYPAIRGEGCDNVECRTAGCKTKFCVLCSVPCYLIEEHGQAWHRPACEHFDGRSRAGGMSQNCRACKMRGALCTPPTNLKLKGRFSFEES